MLETVNNTIITILGIDKLPSEQQAEAPEKQGSLVYQEVVLRALIAMSDEEKNAFNIFVETNPDPDALFAYLSEKVPTINQFVAEEAERLAKENAIDKE